MVSGVHRVRAAPTPARTATASTSTTPHRLGKATIAIPGTKRQTKPDSDESRNITPSTVSTIARSIGSIVRDHGRDSAQRPSPVSAETTSVRARYG